MTSAIVNEIYNSAKKIITTRIIDPIDIISIGRFIMEIVEKYPELSGEEKKQVVIEVVTKIVNETTLGSQQMDTIIDTIITFALPIAIDEIIAASKGKYNLNKLPKCKKCCII